MIALAALLLASAPASAPPATTTRAIDWQVTFSLAIDAEGHATECKIVQSDAPAPLQAKTCEIFMTKASFNPKIDGSGKAVAATYVRTVRFKWPEGAPVPPGAQTPPAVQSIANALETPFQIGAWSGQCRKQAPDDKKFVECDAQFVQPDMIVKLASTYARINIEVRSPNWEPSIIGKTTITQHELMGSALGLGPNLSAILKNAIEAAMLVGKQNCPAFPHQLKADPLDTGPLLEATANLATVNLMKAR